MLRALETGRQIPRGGIKVGTQWVLADLKYPSLGPLHPPPSSSLMNTLLALPRVGLKAELRVLSYTLRPRNYSVRVAASSVKGHKVWDSADEAVKDVKTGDVLLSGGRSLTSSCLSVPDLPGLYRIWIMWYPRCVLKAIKFPDRIGVHQVHCRDVDHRPFEKERCQRAHSCLKQRGLGRRWFGWVAFSIWCDMLTNDF